MNIFRQWYLRNFSDPQAMILALLLAGGFFVVIYWGSMLAPLLASVVIAYLLEAIVALLERKGSRHIFGTNRFLCFYCCSAVFDALVNPRVVHPGCTAGTGITATN